MRDNMRKCSLAKPWWARKQEVIEGFAALLCSFNSNLQCRFYLFLSNKFIQPGRPDSKIVSFLVKSAWGR